MASNTFFRRLLLLPPSLRQRSYSSTTSAVPTPEIYDIITIGGGPVGLSFVAALRSHPSTRGLKIALIDSQSLTPAPSPKDNGGGDGKDGVVAYSNRCSSLTPASIKYMKHIGAWEEMDKSRMQAYHAMDVWDGVSGSKIHFDGVDQTGSGGLMGAIGDMIPGSRFSASRRKYEDGEEAGVVATMCENSNTTSALLRHLQDLNNASTSDSGSGAGMAVLDKTKVESISLGPPASTDISTPDLSQWPIVSTTTSGPLAARLLVGADGANSPVRAFADIPAPGWDYGQHGVVATLQLSHPYPLDAPRTAYQRFLPTGPVALLPLPGGRASLVWSTTPAYAAKLKSLSGEEFTAAVNAAFRLMPVDIAYILGPDAGPDAPSSELAWREKATSAISTGLPANFPRVKGVQEGSVASFPLRMRHADTYTGHRVALIGDAAHTIHPLAGQGLNLGLADAQSLAKQIAYGVEHGMDIGGSFCLENYGAARWAANNAVVGTVDKLHKVYSAGSGPVVWGRSAGVEVLERLGSVKGMLMGSAAGVR
ncbi:putative ubiquinone biosynthesis monooxygenase [Elasticomyces elasticus]|nr:putative ubiquinone biosynthesis monooxygenase [Elasticomyces elasticus]